MNEKSNVCIKDEDELTGEHIQWTNQFCSQVSAGRREKSSISLDDQTFNNLSQLR